MREIYVNLPVSDLETSKRFFTELGFELNEEFTDEKAACVVFGDNIYAMLLTRDFFRGFITDEVANGSSTEVINALSVDGREQVDEFVERALAAGGSEHKPIMEQGPMAAGSFKDPDGHVWEVIHMER
jgi:uncharacterized protein